MLTTGCRDGPYISPCNKNQKTQPKQNHTKKHHQKRQGTASYGRLKKPSRARNRKGPGSLQCPRATWNRVDVTTKSPKTFLKLTLKLCPVNNSFKEKLFDPSKVHPGLQQPKGPRLPGVAATWYCCKRRRQRWPCWKKNREKKRGKNKRISQKLRCASCGDMPVNPNPGSWKKHKG